MQGILTAVSEHELLSRITRDPNICHGKPVVRGLRYPVFTVLEWLASGMTAEEILQDYPDLEMDDLPLPCCTQHGLAKSSVWNYSHDEAACGRAVANTLKQLIAGRARAAHRTRRLLRPRATCPLWA